MALPLAIGNMQQLDNKKNEESVDVIKNPGPRNILNVVYLSCVKSNGCGILIVKIDPCVFQSLALLQERQ